MSQSTGSLFKNAIVLIIIIGIITCSYFLYSSYSPKNTKPVISKVYYEATKGEIQTSISAVGTIFSADARNISAPDGSIVSAVHCKEGQVVRKGDPLFTLTNDAAELDLKKARLNLSLLQTQHDTLKSQQVDQSVYSPIGGIVKKLNVNEKDKVNNDQVVAQIENTSTMTFTAPLSSFPTAIKPYIDSLSVGDYVTVSLSGVNSQKTVKVVSITGSGSGNSITFEVLDTSGLTWGSYYGVSFKVEKKVTVYNEINFGGRMVDFTSKYRDFALAFDLYAYNIPSTDRAFFNSLVKNEIIPMTLPGINGTRKVKVLSVASTPQGNDITFQVFETADVNWSGAYVPTFIFNREASISNKVVFGGSTTDIKAKGAGTASAVYVKAGDRVLENHKLLDIVNNSVDNQVKTASINIEVAQLDADNKQKVVDNLNVKAPVDGMVFNIQVKEGDLVGALTSTVRNPGTSSNSSANLLAMMENRSKLQVWIPVDELDIAKIKVGQDAQIAVDSYKDKTFKGRVSAISPKGTVQNGSAVFQVQVDILASEGLKTGMTANVSIITAYKKDALLIPVDAVQNDKRGKKFVNAKTDDTVSLKEVTVGLMNAENAEIVSGLKEGDKVEVQFEGTSDVAKSKFPGLTGGQGTPPQLKLPTGK